MQKQFKIFLIFLILVLIKQNLAQNKYEEMRNAFLLGLDTKGLEICNDLISLDQNKDYRSETIFFIADYFLQKAFSEDNSIIFINKAYTFYSLYEKDYPNGKDIRAIKNRKRFLENNYFNNIIYGLFLDSLQNERLIVERTLEFSMKLLKFKEPNIFEYLEESKFNDSQGTENKYFDDIIINYPEFEIYAYYYKILLKLSQFKGVNFVSEGILPFDNKDYQIEPYGNQPLSDDDINAQHEVHQLLDVLDAKYPNHPITLNLHLIFCKIFMTRHDGKFNNETLKHLQYILNNDNDQTDYRYMLAKEFILNNKFEEGESK
jgi:hypothetical protein